MTSQLDNMYWAPRYGALSFFRVEAFEVAFDDLAGTSHFLTAPHLAVLDVLPSHEEGALAQQHILSAVRASHDVEDEAEFAAALPEILRGLVEADLAERRLAGCS